MVDRPRGVPSRGRSVLLAALVIADELADANEALQLERSGARAAEAEANAAAGAAANILNGLAQRVETIAARLETS